MKIGVVLPPSFDGRAWLEALAEWAGLSFRRLQQPSFEGVAGLVVVTNQPLQQVARSLANAPIPILVVTEGETNDPGLDSAEVRFGSDPELDPILRRVLLAEPGGRGAVGLEQIEGAVTIASKGKRPVWQRRGRGGAAQDFVFLAPPRFLAGQYLHDHFHRERFLTLLPWLDFLRRVRGAETWQRAPRQASIIFDDPSLYRPTYGFLGFQALAEHASRHRYHVGMATIPFDLAWANPGVTEVFRRHSDVLSLVPHGNDHLAQELAQPRTPDQQLELYAQVLRRVNDFETEHGVHIGRVMEAPHAAFSSGSFPALFALGFEAAMVTPEMLVQYAGRAVWPTSFGLASEFHGGGLPWITRLRLRSGWRTELHLAAFLRQPLVIAGHHQDAAHGLELLEEIADTIHSFGEVAWRPVEDIARHHYARSIQGTTLRIRTMARRVTISVPAGIERVEVECRGGEPDGLERRIWTESGRPLGESQDRAASTVAFAINGPAEVTLVRRASTALEVEQVRKTRRRVWPFVRRLMMEVRDRSQPYWGQRTPALAGESVGSVMEPPTSSLALR